MVIVDLLLGLGVHSAGDGGRAVDQHLEVFGALSDLIRGRNLLEYEFLVQKYCRNTIFKTISEICVYKFILYA